MDFSVIFAYDDEGISSDSSYRLAEILCREFTNYDVDSIIVPLSSLYATANDSSGDEIDNLSLDKHEDINCRLIQLCRSSTNREDSLSVSTLVLLVDNHECTKTLQQFAAILQDWHTDFRISKTLLNGLHFVCLPCVDDREFNSGDNNVTSKEVTSLISSIENSMKILGANRLLTAQFCFGIRDVGQIVTFTNMVNESWESFRYKLKKSESRQNKYSKNRGDTGNDALESTQFLIANTNSPKNDRIPRTNISDNTEACCTDIPLNGSHGSKNFPKCCQDLGEGVVNQQTTQSCCDCQTHEPSESFYSDSDEIADDGDILGCTNEDDIENIGSANDRMVSDIQRQSLIKQGYKLIGDHSAIKLCRWTKARVRGHGGCYKHTFYGIKSNQCMEMTPSLACANKCVFCWRHHTNPVATRWKWESDDPDFLAQESVNAHLRLIKELKGIFDTKSERLSEAMTVRHCALSLVGEPIMYPQINELLDELHQRRISTFLVTNAQFPKEMENLRQVTQLYLSIDAADETSLKNTDRPLFRDFWARFQRCIQLLKHRKERTVFRLTLVKNFNITEQQEEISDYGRLIELGEPDFIEIKAVTFCGTVHDNAITMKNVPWHDEVVSYAKALVGASSFTRQHYDIACVHRHSCCVLVANTSYRINGKWHTWIDYDKFHELAMSGHEFHGIDYSIETPDWGLYGSKEEGFDPVDTRVYTKGRKKLPGPPEPRQQNM
ncbi:Wyosine base formation family protein [Babesia bovis T2Bo]|uniref:Radical SAM core domain-containing protein n=1 Tax=Babesia bovis TaxID=5865 RepID=A7AV72_BABBO|nr:Wyosine base formation family protein [Babesia bovis T2Bo]EDO05698.1 Wyosine base formation family protein [Babesia bovis T2Bo]|eukprot:XP_001609266.1 hypothetical protein [Babesia bovis T2Bo]